MQPFYFSDLAMQLARIPSFPSSARFGTPEPVESAELVGDSVLFRNDKTHGRAYWDADNKTVWVHCTKGREPKIYKVVQVDDHAGE